MPPSVCIITQNVSFGGVEVHTLGVMRALIDRGYAIELVANRYHGYDEIVRQHGWSDRVRILHTELTGILYGERSDRQGWRELLGRISSPVLIFPKGNNNYGQVGFLRECRRAFKKIVFIEHQEARPRPPISRRKFGVLPALGLWWHKKRFFSRMGSRYADTIVAVSGQVRERLVGDFGYAPEKTVVIPNGVPWRQFVRDSRHGRASREKYGIPQFSYVFGMLSRLDRDKGIDTALHALARLTRVCTDRSFYLVIAGEGYEREMLQELARELGVQDRVKFIGFVSRPEEVLSAFDVILFSSRVEGLPLGLLQGMAAGCLPIVTRISGMPEAVNSPNVGWVVAPDNPDELCDAMKEALAYDRDASSQMRQNVVRRIRDHFDLAESNRRLLDVCGL